MAVKTTDKPALNISWGVIIVLRENIGPKTILPVLSMTHLCQPKNWSKCHLSIGAEEFSARRPGMPEQCRCRAIMVMGMNTFVTGLTPNVGALGRAPTRRMVNRRPRMLPFHRELNDYDNAGRVRALDRAPLRTPLELCQIDFTTNQTISITDLESAQRRSPGGDPGRPSLAWCRAIGFRLWFSGRRRRGSVYS